MGIEDGISRRAAKLASFFTILITSSLVSVVILAFGIDLPVIALNIILGFVVGFPASFLLFLALEWARARWRRGVPERVAPKPSVGASAPTAPFRHSARRWKASLAVLATVLGLSAIAVLVPVSGEDSMVRPLVVLRWLLVLLGLIAVPVSLHGHSRTVFEVDDVGVRVSGRLRPFDLTWGALGRIEVVEVPILLSPPFDEGTRMPKTYRLSTKDGNVVGTLAPVAELGEREGRSLERALLEYAARHGLPVREESWWATQSWRAGKRPSNP